MKESLREPWGNPKAVKNLKNLSFGKCSCGHYYNSIKNRKNHRRRCLEDAEALERRLVRVANKVFVKTTKVEFRSKILDGVENKVNTEGKAKTSEETVMNVDSEKPSGNVINKECNDLEEKFKTKSLKELNMNTCVLNQEANKPDNFQIKIEPAPMEDANDEQETIEKVNSSIAVQTIFTGGLVDELQLFHAEVAGEVKATLNLYYPEAKEFVGEARVRSKEQYVQVARHLSHYLRERIKESYSVLHGGLQEVKMTKDHKVFIRTIVRKFLMDS